MIYLEIITSIIIFFIMAYLSAISTAYLMTDDKDLKLYEINDKKKIKRLKFIFSNSSIFITSVRYGISFCSLWLGALIVEIIASPIYRQYNFTLYGVDYVLKYCLILVTIILLSYILYLYAEIIPKALAIKKKDIIVLKTINFVYILSKLFYPIIKFLRATDEIIMRLFNVQRKDKILYKDSEVIESVEIAKEQGVLSKQEGKVISNFLKLDELTAKDIMRNIEECIVLDINNNKKQIKEIILKSGYTRLPVCDKNVNKILGIVNIKNIFENMMEYKDKEITQVNKFVKPCMKVSSGKRLDLLFNEMKNNKEQMAIVVKEKDIAIGIVTMEDIVEQIVGMIEDDFEKYKK